MSRTPVRVATARHGLLLRSPFAHEVAHHDQPGRDPDPAAERFAAGGGQPGHRRRCRQSGERRTAMAVPTTRLLAM